MEREERGERREREEEDQIIDTNQEEAVWDSSASAHHSNLWET